MLVIIVKARGSRFYCTWKGLHDLMPIITSNGNHFLSDDEFMMCVKRTILCTDENGL